MSLAEHLRESTRIHAEARRLWALVLRLTPEQRADMADELRLLVHATAYLAEVDRTVVPRLVDEALAEILADPA